MRRPALLALWRHCRASDLVPTAAIRCCLVATAAICRRSVRCGFTIHCLPARHHAPSRPPHALFSSHRKLMHLSLQVGCAMGCTFCATGTMGLTADLTAGEIVEQLVHARRVAQIRNIVFMVGAAAVGVQDYCSTPLAVLPLAMEADGRMRSIVCLGSKLWADVQPPCSRAMAQSCWATAGSATQTTGHGTPPSQPPEALCCPFPALCAAQGMGEPLNNYGAVRSAVGMMTDPRYFGL